jgi:hypothetical protein
MSPTIMWPSASEIQLIDDIRDAIGREVKFMVVGTTTECPICTIDPITNTSTDSFCPICSGVGYLYTYSGVSLSGHITWGGTDQLNWQTGGQLFDGDCRIQIKYTPANVWVVDNTKWIEVDDKGLQILHRTYRGVKELNRILIDCIERDKDV